MLRAEVLATEDAETWRCCAARVVTVLARPSGRLLAAVAVAFVALVEAEPVDPAEGGRGGRNEVVEAKEVADDIARVCAIVRGDCGLAVEGEAKFVGLLEEVPLEDGGKDSDGTIIDLGRVNLIAVVGIRRMLFGGSAPFLATLSVGDGRAATGFDRLGPKIPEFGLLLVLVVEVVAVLLPAAEGPARVRAAAILEAPGLGNLLGDESRYVSTFDEDAGATVALLLVSGIFFASSFLASSFLGTLPSPAVGWRRERVRFSPVAEEDDDMVSELLS